MGNSLTVEQRSLTPSVLVRIQVPQPYISKLSSIIYNERVSANALFLAQSLTHPDRPIPYHYGPLIPFSFLVQLARGLHGASGLSR